MWGGTYVGAVVVVVVVPVFDGTVVVPVDVAPSPLAVDTVSPLGLAPPWGSVDRPDAGTEVVVLDEFVVVVVDFAVPVPAVPLPPSAPLV
jgi:hypothetical protein